MTWLETVTDLVRLGSVTGAASSYLRGMIIGQGVSQGASANSILSALTNAGIGIRRNQGLALVAEEQDRQAAGATANQLDLNSPASDLLGVTPPTGWTGQYVHQVTATYRTTDEEGNYILHTRTLGLKSSQVMTPSESIEAAQQIMTSEIPADEEDNYPLPSDVLAMNLTGVWYDTQGRSLSVIG